MSAGAGAVIANLLLAKSAYSIFAMSPAGAIKRLRGRASQRPVDEEGERWEAIAQQVAVRRRARDLSQHELAELCATTQSAIARLERGARPPRLDTLLRIANALDCELIVELRPRTRLEKESS
jgi:ribosome-binding protein aMBF1 (putative translation factor)